MIEGNIAMSKKILCPTDGSDHAAVGLAQAIELAKQSGASLTVCVVNIAHGGARGPTINHWEPADVAALMAAAEVTCKTAGLADVGTVEVVAREAAPAIGELNRRRRHGLRQAARAALPGHRKSL